MFFGLMRIFRRDYIAMCFLLAFKVSALYEEQTVELKSILQSVLTLLSPVAINRLLTYLGDGGKDAVVRPWVWILLLFLSPMVGSAVFGWWVRSARTKVG